MTLRQIAGRRITCFSAFEGSSQWRSVNGIVSKRNDAFNMKGRHASTAAEGIKLIWCGDRRAAVDDPPEAPCPRRAAGIAAGADRTELCPGSDDNGRGVLAPSASRLCATRRTCG